MRKRERVTGRALGWKQSITEHLKMLKVGKLLSKVCKSKKFSYRSSTAALSPSSAGSGLRRCFEIFTPFLCAAAFNTFRASESLPWLREGAVSQN